jgi:hypothetical protein
MASIASQKDLYASIIDQFAQKTHRNPEIPIFNISAHVSQIPAAEILHYCPLAKQCHKKTCQLPG